MTAAVLLASFLLAQGGGARTVSRTAKTTGPKASTTKTSTTKTGTTKPGSGAAPTTAKKATRAADGQRRTPQPAGGGLDEGGQDAIADGATAGGLGKNFKSKTYSFGAMDVEESSRRRSFSTFSTASSSSSTCRRRTRALS